jgi:hypothetical protein
VPPSDVVGFLRDLPLEASESGKDVVTRGASKETERDEEILRKARSQEVFFGKGRCATCHPAPSDLDNQMHDLRVERFYKPRTINEQWIHAEGPIKTFTLRGIKDSPPYLRRRDERSLGPSDASCRR